MELKEVLTSIEKLYNELVLMGEQAKKEAAELLDTRIALDKRAEELSEMESAAVVLARAHELTGQMEQKQIDLDNQKATFENYKQGELQRIKDATATYNTLTDREAELRKSWEVLEKEKAEYTVRIKEDLIRHFKNTKG